MKPTLFGVALALTLASAAYGRSAADTETIPLRFLGAKDVVTSVKMPPGIEDITLHLNDNSITVRGDREAVITFKAALTAADVQQVSYRVDMRLIRCHVDAQGKITETVVDKSTILDLDRHEASTSVTQGDGGYAILFTPAKVDDKTVALIVETRELGEQGEVVRSGKNARSVLLGETVRITGMTDDTDKILRRAAQKGEVLTDRGAYTATYVEITPTIPAIAGAHR